MRLAAIGITLALSLVTVSSAEARPKDVTYSFPSVQLTDRDGSVGTYGISGGVQYNRDGTVTTGCQYGKYPYAGAPPSQIYPDGYYRVVKSTADIPDTSAETVLQYCKDHFVDRIY